MALVPLLVQTGGVGGQTDFHETHLIAFFICVNTEINVEIAVKYISAC